MSAAYVQTYINTQKRISLCNFFFLLVIIFFKGEPAKNSSAHFIKIPNTWLQYLRIFSFKLCTRLPFSLTVLAAKRQLPMAGT